MNVRITSLHRKMNTRTSHIQDSAHFAPHLPQDGEHEDCEAEDAEQEEPQSASSSSALHGRGCVCRCTSVRAEQTCEFSWLYTVEDAHAKARVSVRVSVCRWGWGGGTVWGLAWLLGAAELAQQS